MDRYQLSTTNSEIPLYALVHATHVDWQADPRPIRGRPRLVRGLYAPAGAQPRVPRNGRVQGAESADSDPRIFTFSTADIPGPYVRQ